MAAAEDISVDAAAQSELDYTFMLKDEQSMTLVLARSQLTTAMHRGQPQDGHMWVTLPLAPIGSFGLDRLAMTNVIYDLANVPSGVPG